MKFKHHLAQSLTLQPSPSPWPRMTLSGLSVLLPLMIGYFRNELDYAVFGSLFGFILILNDHFGPLSTRILHLLTAFIFIISGFLFGVMVNGNLAMTLLALFALAFVLGKAKGLGLELERMLLFTTLQFLAGSQLEIPSSAGFIPLYYASLALVNYLLCLCLVFLFLRHQPNFQKSKRAEFKEAFQRKESQRYAFTMAVVSCLGFMISQHFHINRGYWAVGTILIVMMPDQYQTLYRSFQRMLGTTIGVLLAIFILKVAVMPFVLIASCSLMAFLAPLGLIRNYWLGNVFIASMIMIFLTLSHQTNGSAVDLALVRLTDIGLGCLLGSIGTVVAFPEILKKRRIKKD